MQMWATRELESVKLGDRRLKQRLVQLVERFTEHPARSIPAACKNWAETKATYRFLSSDKVEAEAIRAAHREKTIERFAVRCQAPLHRPNSLLLYKQLFYTLLDQVDSWLAKETAHPASKLSGAD